MATFTKEQLHEGQETITYNEAGITYNEASKQYNGITQTIWTEESLESNNT